jgi:hypothetical protein
VFPARDAVVTWTLRDGKGGARLVLTHTGAAAEHVAAWHDLIESLAAASITRT